jgi:hypothetical protein
MEPGDEGRHQDTTEYLLEDYKVKVQYLTDHLSRMWTRFNFILVLNSGLFAFSVQKDVDASDWLFILAGMVLSILWYAFGANDNYLVEVYRKQVECSFELLGLKKELQDPGNPNKLAYFSYAGDPQDRELLPQNMHFRPFLKWLLKRDKGSEQNTNLLQWRWIRWWRGDEYSTSPHYMAAIMPIAFLLLWIVRFITYLDEVAQ